MRTNKDILRQTKTVFFFISKTSLEKTATKVLLQQGKKIEYRNKVEMQ